MKLPFALAAATACCVEFGQLYHSPWIDPIRQTLPGRLVLGSGFDPYDLAAYLAGCLLGLAAARATLPKSA